MQAHSTEVLGHRYRLLGRLGEGGMGVVYRAADRLTGHMVALKRVHVQPRDRQLATQELLAETSAPEAASVAMLPTGTPVRWGQQLSAKDQLAFRLALAQEFHTLASLRHPNIISVLDYGFDADAQPFFTMELLENTEPLLQNLRSQPPKVRQDVLAQILRALDYLHRRGILHRDLKPSNILLLQVRGEFRVKLLDFGLALERHLDGSKRQEVAGTLGYMAPEVLRGEASTEASDLYAVGMIAHELLTGRHPFADLGDHQLVQAALTQDVTGEPLSADPLLKDWVLRLVQRNPLERFRSTHEALLALVAVSDAVLAMESSAARESFLQAARFVGREREFAALREALDAAQQGHGATFLVSGESGVGKSRLLDELRTLALVRGIRVLRGHAEATGGSARQHFLEVLRAILLDTTIDQEEASVLKTMLPELPALLGREIPDPPTVSPQAVQQRALRVLLSVMTRSNVPTLMLLEDIHWAPIENIVLLRGLSAIVSKRPLLLVATFRDDERPDLARSVPAAVLLKLPRFDASTIAKLSHSMLGEAGDKPEIVDFLTRETEGNAFFMVEVVRALAEEAGGLSEVGRRSLPRQLVANGMQTVVARRLDRVPDWARPLLRLAAISGRQLDRRLLGDLEPDLERWLQACADAAILEISDEEWQFTHDKLRERLVSSLKEEERRALHRQIGEAMERVYGLAGTHVGLMGYHFEEAAEKRKAGRYLAQAGTDAYRRGGLPQAAGLLERTLALQTASQAPLVERTATLGRLSRTLYGLGRNDECVQAIRQAMGLVGSPIPESAGGRRLAILRELGHEIRHRIFGIPMVTNEEERALKQEALRFLIGTGDSIFVAKGQFDVVLYLMLYGLHAAEQIGDVRHQITYLSSVGFTAYLLPFHTASRFYMRRAKRLAESLKPAAPMSGYCFFGGLMAIAEGRLEEAAGLILQARDLAHTTQELGQEALAHNILGSVSLERDQLDAVVEHGLCCERLGLRIGNLQLAGSGQAWQAMALLRRGEVASALEQMQRALVQMEQGSSRIHKLTLNGALSLCALRANQPTLAREQCDQALRRMARTSAPAPSFMVGYSSVLETTLALWQAAIGTADEPAAAKRVRQALKQMVRFAMVYPVGRPWALLGIGRFLSQKGFKNLGQLSLRWSLTMAKRFDLAQVRELARDALADRPSDAK